MKMRKISGIFVGTLIAASVLVACKDDFLESKAIGGLSEENLKTKAGIEGTLIGAYSLLDGTGSVTNNWQAAGSNFVFGSITSDDAYKGSEPSDQPSMLIMERYETLPSTGFMNEKWRTLYDGIARANDVLRLMKDVNLSEADANRISGEARFLRGHYHFDARQVYEKVPYVDENTFNLGDLSTAKVANDKEIWPMIEADFQYAVENLPETQGNDAGRANKSAAKAYLAKVYMFQGKYAEALPLLNEVINSGVTARGVKYALEEKFSDIYRIENKNNEEIVFAYQSSVNDGANAVNANAAEVLNYPHNTGPGGCCGFHQPSQNLVNSYKVDALGLPLLDTYNQSDLKNDNGLKSDQAFTPDAETPVDPRLDQTVGRRGIPFYDWGVHPGADWVRTQSQMGPYTPKKKIFRKSDVGQYTDGTSWTPGYNAQTHAIIRFAEVLLWAAEAEAEAGSLVRATELVNMVRQRAANPEDFVKLENGELAANYQVGLYPIFPSQDLARKAIRFERKIELAMEGQRFFDLVRWGVAAEVLNDYLAVEATKRPYLQGAHFTKGQDEYFPIPEQQITLSQVNGQPVLQPNRNQ
jgi:hypothetical protein